MVHGSALFARVGDAHSRGWMVAQRASPGPGVTACRTDGGQPLAGGGIGLIRRQDAKAAPADVLGRAPQLLCEGVVAHGVRQAGRPRHARLPPESPAPGLAPRLHLAVRRQGAKRGRQGSTLAQRPAGEWAAAGPCQRRASAVQALDPCCLNRFNNSLPFQEHTCA